MRYICTAFVATLALAGTSFAATINVPGDHATIQGAKKRKDGSKMTCKEWAERYGFKYAEGEEIPDKWIN